MFNHMDRYADRSALIRNRPGNGLPDPPGGIGGKTEALPVIIFFHCADQSQIPLLDQIHKAHAVAGIMLGDGYDQSQIRFLQLVPGLLIPVFHTPGKFDLLLACEQGNPSDVFQVHVDRIRHHPALRIQFGKTLRSLVGLRFIVRFPVGQFFFCKVGKQHIHAFLLQLLQNLIHLLLGQMKRAQEIGHLAVFQDILF